MSINYNTGLHDVIHSIEKSHFWFRSRRRLLNLVLVRFIKKPQTTTFLEIGYGTGVVLQLLESIGFRTFGLDVNKKAYTYAKKTTRATLYVSSLSSFKTDKRFDCVGAFDVLEHQSNDRAFLLQCHRLLRDRGLLFLTVPAHQRLWSQQDAYAGHRRRYSDQRLRQLLEECSFEIVYLNHWQVLTLPFYLLWKAFIRSKDSDPLLSGFLRTPQEPINSIMYAILAVERRLVFKVHFPIGGSLIAVARRR
ncbi:hypothetical protein A2154_00045 [Candidatus Gottesmanbacteria bacterium RBG_16_43_7]|uniref:Methyltransferase type 11 domain-containing protein n=1 Tax=Candidatus Gottesmanbacteria bacterium RBG_16_43_7 TaxID=1798373 RepID=A0A1F5ZB57_9BACT|nr:MAG: hypothetical protein A2154_00045 [Candidatus Gottesmanbacteria bacterium RBG_16_43_7]